MIAEGVRLSLKTAKIVFETNSIVEQAVDPMCKTQSTENEIVYKEE